MLNSIPDILARIVAQKRAELAAATVPRDRLERQAELCAAQRRDFSAALRRLEPAVIAELKKASPSKGLLCSHYDPPKLATEYEQGGAAALSVLTDQRFFQGSLEDLRAARAAVSLPVLRKDFTIDAYHVLEAAAAGADAILLIAAVLSTDELRRLRELAGRCRMAALVEVHDRDELQSALDSGAEIIGVNNRNLRTFEVKLETALELANEIPARLLRVAESGIHSAEDLRRLRAAGFDAFLVGERLVTSPSPALALKALLA